MQQGWLHSVLQEAGQGSYKIAKIRHGLHRLNLSASLRTWYSHQQWSPMLILPAYHTLFALLH